MVCAGNVHASENETIGAICWGEGAWGFANGIRPVSNIFNLYAYILNKVCS